MNRITRIAALTLSLAAAGSAFAESPTPEPAATPYSHAPLAVVTGAMHDFDFGSAPAYSVLSRTEVRQDVLAAIADGSLHTFGEIDTQVQRGAAPVAQRLALAAR